MLRATLILTLITCLFLTGCTMTMPMLMAAADSDRDQRLPPEELLAMKEKSSVTLGFEDRPPMTGVYLGITPTRDSVLALSPHDTVTIFDDGYYRDIRFADLSWIKKHTRSHHIMAGFLLGLAIDYMFLRYFSPFEGLSAL